MVLNFENMFYQTYRFVTTFSHYRKPEATMGDPREPNTREPNTIDGSLTDAEREPNTLDAQEAEYEREPNTDAFREPNTEN